MELYHIHRILNDEKENAWQVGNTVIFDDSKYNEFISLSLDYKPNLNVNPATNDSLAFEISTRLKEYPILIRELAYEEIRRRFYPEKPSRYNCIWLCTRDSLKYWCQFVTGNIKIFKVSVEGDIFKSSNSLLGTPSLSYNELLEKAKDYWSYNSNLDKVDDEYLYCGDVKILEEINI